MRDLRQTKVYADHMSGLNWIVEKQNDNYYFIKHFPILGSFIKLQRPEKLIINEVYKITNKHKAFQILIEPKKKSQEKKLISASFKKTSSYLPTKTLILDLTKSPNEILKKTKKDCRQAINKTNKLKTKEAKNTKEINAFQALWLSQVNFKRYVPSIKNLLSLKNAFKDNSLFLFFQDSGAIFLIADAKAYYWQAFVGKKGRKEKLGYQILWQGILWAKQKKAKVFDFEGIEDERFPNKAWHGFTHFKKSFSGKEVYYPGSYKKNTFFFKK